MLTQLSGRGVEPLPLLRALVDRYLKRYHGLTSPPVGEAASNVLFELDAMISLPGLDQTLWEETAVPSSPSSRFIPLWDICAGAVEHHSRVLLEQLMGDNGLSSQDENEDEDEDDSTAAAGRAGNAPSNHTSTASAPILKNEPLTVSFQALQTAVLLLSTFIAHRRQCGESQVRQRAL